VTSSIAVKKKQKQENSLSVLISYSGGYKYKKAIQPSDNANWKRSVAIMKLGMLMWQGWGKILEN
jgi:hypothetical protein